MFSKLFLETATALYEVSYEILYEVSYEVSYETISNKRYYF